MIEIKDFKLGSSSQISCTENQLLNNEGFLKLKQIEDHLNDKGFCHVRIRGGDYDGSIAKFTPDSNLNHGKFYWRVYCSELRWGVRYHWSGRLSWKGKRNNPQFTVMYNTCDVLLDYEGEEILKRFDLKSEGKLLLKQDIYDIDCNKLNIGDEVLYMNLRYGNGGKLCHGTIKGFKAHTREGYVSVLITNKECLDEESELRQPSYQIFKKHS